VPRFLFRNFALFFTPVTESKALRLIIPFLLETMETIVGEKAKAREVGRRLNNKKKDGSVQFSWSRDKDNYVLSKYQKTNIH